MTVQEEFKKLELAWIRQFFELEAKSYPQEITQAFIMEVLYPKVIELIDEYADEQVSLTSLSNMGYEVRKVTFDRYSTEPKGTEFKGDIAVMFCPCGTNLSMAKINKKPALTSLQKDWEEKIEVLLTGSCHTNELWVKHEKEWEEKKEPGLLSDWPLREYKTSN